jgi:hypothetical protein
MPRRLGPTPYRLAGRSLRPSWQSCSARRLPSRGASVPLAAVGQASACHAGTRPIRFGATPYRLAGRSPSPSRLRLTRTCLRCGILPALVSYAGSTAGVTPRLPQLKARGVSRREYAWRCATGASSRLTPRAFSAQKFRRSRSVGTRRRRESLRTHSARGPDGRVITSRRRSAKERTARCRAVS